VPTELLNKARAPMPGVPFYALLENRAQTVGLQVGLGIRLDDAWSVGASMLALAALNGHIDVGADAAGRFTSTSEQQLLADYAPILGARWRASDALTTGLTVRFASQSSYDILVTNDLAEAIPVTLPELRFAGVAQYDPFTVALEGAFSRRAWLFSGQVAYERWSAFPRPTENPVASSDEPTPAPDFHDVVVPRLGATWRGQAGGLDLALRGGYFFAWSPAPEMKGAVALLDNHRHVLSLGLGLADPTSEGFPFHLDVWFQLHVLQPRTHDRPEPEPDLETGGVITVGGLTLGVDL
jgi:hypothetical protein